jgi:hypothetical protein
MHLRSINSHLQQLIHKEHLTITVGSLSFSSEVFDYSFCILDSIMHYDDTAFSSNGKRTIIPKSSTATIGQQQKLSPIDIKEIQLFYKCQ